jgi:hypothetical protein
VSRCGANDERICNNKQKDVVGNIHAKRASAAVPQSGAESFLDVDAGLSKSRMNENECNTAHKVMREITEDAEFN